jgi:hypothetical protein
MFKMLHNTAIKPSDATMNTMLMTTDAVVASPTEDASSSQRVPW